ncbi:hypothetical protein [Enterobacter hormaechei]|uniref:hypothetical protein n=1 Tax=Enterobacter hormaechei TaxID=158836 RepID=UPI000CDEBF11|nr:hypothetical protein [Enterobacter hormaechei]RTN21755.1 hypothetical protein EKN92_00790 [Enterobacter hormaechei]UJC74869.1 hypothetical protein J4O68_06105 [Enterobacter hormaechei]
MTNVSAVEKMAELMQQMEENSPRVAALQYCLTQVAEKVEEAEKRNAELEARCAALSAENSGLKSAIDATIGWQQSTDPENVESVRMLVDVKTPATDAFLAEVRNEAGALAVELFAQTLGSPYSVRDEKCYEDGFTRAIEVVRDIQAPRFAYKIRQAGM